MTIDATNAAEGYLMVKASSKKKLKLRISRTPRPTLRLERQYGNLSASDGRRTFR